MTHSRRSFLSTSIATGAVLGLLPRFDPALGADPLPVEPASRSLKILILGGTGFLGPHTVEYAMKRGHDVTLFNRGRTNPQLFKDIEKLVGDRDPNKGDGLKALQGTRRWDLVIDTSGYVPRIVKASAELLADRVSQYIFVSTISVYADHSVPDMDETAAMATIDDPANEEVRKHYGPLKALCEQAAEAAMPRRTANIRPGLIVGPRDFSDRFTYWPLRVERGGEILAPGAPSDPIQFIDARDLGRWMIHCAENNITGVYNATGPGTPTSIAELLYGCKAVSGGTATFTWVDNDFLTAHEVAPWSDMPVWVPPVDEYGGFGSVSITRALSTGLTYRPLAETVADTIDWFHTLPEDRQSALRAGLSAERETEVLRAWHADRAANGVHG